MSKPNTTRRIIIEFDYSINSYRIGFDGGFTPEQQEGFGPACDKLARQMKTLGAPTEPLQMIITTKEEKPNGEKQTG